MAKFLKRDDVSKIIKSNVNTPHILTLNVDVQVISNHFTIMLMVFVLDV